MICRDHDNFYHFKILLVQRIECPEFGLKTIYYYERERLTKDYMILECIPDQGIVDLLPHQISALRDIFGSQWAIDLYMGWWRLCLPAASYRIFQQTQREQKLKRILYG